MSSKARKRRIVYPYSTVRIYWSATIVVLSIILALLILPGDPVSLLYYLVLTAIVTSVVLALKMRFLRVRSLEPSKEELSETESGVQSWKPLLILIGVLIVSLTLPLLLARYHPEFWFISLISYTSSVSIAEVLFFLIIRKS